MPSVRCSYSYGVFGIVWGPSHLLSPLLPPPLLPSFPAPTPLDHIMRCSTSRLGALLPSLSVPHRTAIWPSHIPCHLVFEGAMDT